MEKTDLFLKYGKIKAEGETVKGLEHDFKLRSPVSTASVRGTTFVYSGDELRVEKGSVAFTNTIGQKRTMGGGETSKISGYCRFFIQKLFLFCL